MSIFQVTGEYFKMEKEKIKQTASFPKSNRSPGFWMGSLSWCGSTGCVQSSLGPNACSHSKQKSSRNMIVLKQSSSLRPLPISYSWHSWCLPFTPSPGWPLMSLFPGLDGSLISGFCLFLFPFQTLAWTLNTHQRLKRRWEARTERCYSDCSSMFNHLLC